MRSPMRPMPEPIGRWMSRVQYCRWADAAVALIVLGCAVVMALPDLKSGVQASIAVVAFVLLVLVPALRIRWRPVSAWVGLAVSRRLRPGDRAWWVQAHRGEPVIVTARRGLRLTIATGRHGESEALRIRRTRVFIVPADS